MITLEQAKAHLRVDHTHEDDLIQRMIDAATQSVANHLDMHADDMEDYIDMPAPVAAISDVRVILRYRTGTNTAMRIRHGEDTYEIESIANVNSANREIELLCKRVA